MAVPFTFASTDNFVYTVNGTLVQTTGTSMRNRGDWVEDSFYQINDVVTYTQAQFIALLDNSAQPPTANVNDEWSHLTRVDLSIYGFGTQAFSLTRSFLTGRRV